MEYGQSGTCVIYINAAGCTGHSFVASSALTLQQKLKLQVMKLKTLILSLLLGTGLYAQDSCFQYNAGGFGHFYTGPAFLQMGNLREYLERPDVMNVNLPVRPGTISGGEGAALLGRFILGGGGFGQTIFRETTDSARVNVYMGGGYFKFGYVCMFRSGNFGYAYGGIGWGGVNVHVENLTDETQINFNHQSPLSPGFKGDYSLSTNFYDIGFSYKKIFMSGDNADGDGGFMVGLDLGCMFALPSGDWESDKDTVVSGPPVTPGFFNPYLRVTIGGGGFGVK